MSVAKVSEITVSSPTSFEDALRLGIERASKTLDNITSAWIQDHEVAISNGKITEYKIRLRITFVLK
jgi:flavin-binding protein dodecin